MLGIFKSERISKTLQCNLIQVQASSGYPTSIVLNVSPMIKNTNALKIAISALGNASRIRKYKLNMEEER